MKMSISLAFVADYFREKKKAQMFGILVALIAFFIYANALGNGLVWDDNNVIVTNPVLQGSVISLFKAVDVGRDYDLLPYYRPLSLLSFLIEKRMHGLSPFPMHLVNILLHAACTWLVYLLARSILNDPLPAFFTGLIFAVHPINTEVVDLVSGRNTLFACFFILSAYLIHRRSIISGKWSLEFAGALFLMAGLFCKEIALMAFLFIIVMEITLMRTKGSGMILRNAMRLIPYAAAIFFYLFMRWSTLSNLGIQKSFLPGLGAGKIEGFYKIPALGARLLDNLYIIPRYLLTVIWPAALSPRYVVPEDLLSLAVPLALSWICIVGVSIWLLTLGKSRATFFGIAWIAVFWLPVSGLIFFPSAPMAERYLYIPAIGLWLIIADQASRLMARAEVRRYGIVAAVVVVLALSALTVRRNMDWKSDVTLFSRFVEQFPDNIFAHAGLGEAYFIRDKQDVNKLASAEAEFEKVLAFGRQVPPGIHSRLGYIRHAREDYEGALKYYTIALGVFPSDKEVLLNRGIVFENLGRQREALEDFKRFMAVPGYELADARPYAEARIRELSK